MNRSGGLNGIVEKHANMRAYLQHRQRVLDMKSRVDSKRPRSKSLSRVMSVKEVTEKSKIDGENLRLLDSLIQISKRKSELGSYSSSPSRSKSCSRSSVSSSSTILTQASKLQR